MLAVALAATLALAQGQIESAPATLDDWGDEETEYEEPAPPRLSLWGFGGAVFEPGAGRNDSVLGGEVSYRFDPVEVGLYGAGYRLEEGRSEWSPVMLLRVMQRFETARGLDALFAFGAGAARTDRWQAWFQVTIGARLNLGPAFVGGELSFEQNDLLRLVGGVGVRL